ncbi:hypothetical protein A1OE_89 [Candidatus Endolissoclinum faulkneri L2]|uniref:Uncharacterized protein n=1 Tax=Candidatus Endolissoclinum faulkneri L2 TaxID=1193729 RepID=K7YFD8_9PROT|nr:hypothetical protein A1OE_89 [Candidatus Endolissoclinum faulkneri L2]
MCNYFFSKLFLSFTSLMHYELSVAITTILFGVYKNNIQKK